MSRQLRHNITALFTLQAATYALPLISLPYLTRVLGTENFGRMAFAMAVIQYFTVLTDYGFNLSATQRVAIVKDDEAELSKILSAVVALKFMLCLAGALGLTVLLYFVPVLSQDWRLYALAYLAVLGHALFPVWLFQGMERMTAVTACSIAAQLLSLLALFAWVQDADHYRTAAALQAAAPLAAGVLAWIILWRAGNLRLRWPGRRYLAQTLQEGWHVFISTAAISLYTTTNIVVLGLLTNPQTVAYFAVADKLIKAVHGLTSPLSQAVYPHVARLGAQSRDAALAFIGRLLRWQSLATLAFSCGLFVLADFIVRILFGPGFEESMPVVQWMALLPFVVGLSNVFGVQTMLNFGLKRSFSRILLGSGLINLALLVPLASHYGAQGAAASVLMTELVVVVLMGLSLAREGLLSRLLYRSAA
ncbi:MAG: flippase [Ramlibacter sp.]|nr:flippase [Ramlibacter sp.]